MGRGFDLAFLLTNSIGTALAAVAGGVPERWGFSTEGRGLFLTRKAKTRRRVRNLFALHSHDSLNDLIVLTLDDPPKDRHIAHLHRRQARDKNAGPGFQCGPHAVRVGADLDDIKYERAHGHQIQRTQPYQSGRQGRLATKSLQ